METSKCPWIYPGCPSQELAARPVEAVRRRRRGGDTTRPWAQSSSSGRLRPENREEEGGAHGWRRLAIVKLWLLKSAPLRDSTVVSGGHLPREHQRHQVSGAGFKIKVGAGRASVAMKLESRPSLVRVYTSATSTFNSLGPHLSPTHAWLLFWTRFISVF